MAADRLGAHYGHGLPQPPVETPQGGQPGAVQIAGLLQSAEPMVAEGPRDGFVKDGRVHGRGTPRRRLQRDEPTEAPAERLQPLLRVFSGDDLVQHAVPVVDFGARRVVRAELTAGPPSTPVQPADRSGRLQDGHDGLPRGGDGHDLRHFPATREAPRPVGQRS